MQRVIVTVSDQATNTTKATSTFRSPGNRHSGFIPIVSGAGAGSNSVTFGPYDQPTRVSLGFQHSKDSGTSWEANQVKAKDVRAFLVFSLEKISAERMAMCIIDRPTSKDMAALIW